MPFIEDKDQQVQFDRLIDYSTEVEAGEPDYTFRERVRAAFAIDNTIGSLIARESGLPDGTKTTDYDAWTDLTDDERLDEAFINNITYVDNRQELDAVRRQRDKELKNREILQEGGLLPSLAVGLVDPINVLLPGSVAYKTYKTGSKILDGALATASAGALSATATETALHATQLERTFSESALNVSAATFLSGALGAAPGVFNQLVSKSQLDEIDKTLDPERVVREGGNPAMADHSIGAAEVDNDAQVRGKVAKMFVKGLGFDPLSRTITSDASATRKAVNALAENPIDMDRPVGTSVESMIKAYDGRYFEAASDSAMFFKEYKKSGGTLNNRQFREEVGRAMRNGSDNTYIQQAADSWRTKLYEPLKDESVKMGLLPEDVDVTTAESYLNRIWNKEKLAANSGEFISVTKKWLDDQLEVKVGKKAEIDKLTTKFTEVEKGEASAAKRKATAERQITEIEKKLEETKRAEKPKAPKAAKNTLEKAKVDQPLKATVYHQTDKTFEKFDFDKSADGTVWFTGDKEVFKDPTSAAAASAGKGKILTANVELKKVAGWDEIDKYSIGELIQKGYDGAVLDGDLQVFTESAIKSVKEEIEPKVAKPSKRVQTLEKQIADRRAKIAEYDKQLGDFEAQKLQSTKDIEAVIKDFPSKIANEVRSMIKAREGVEAKSMTRTLKRAIARIQKAGYEDIEPVDNEALAREILGRIMSTPDGRLPYDYKMGENSAKGMAGPEKGVFKKRSFLIPDSMVEQFLENDIELLGGRYLKQMAPDIELTRRFGDVELKNEIKNIEQEYIEKMSGAKTQKERLKLNKQKDSDIRDIAAMRDRMRGTYGQVDFDNPWVRAGRVARDLNYMRLLGGVVAASIPDIGRVIAAEGIVNTFRYGLKPLVANLREFRVAAREAKLYGVGTDALMGGRAEIIADVADYARGGTKFERGVRAAATKFSSINLMNFWTGGIKQLHAVVTQTRVANDLLKGKYDKRLGQLGISEADSKNIAGQLKKYGKEIDGVWVWNTRDWDNQDLAMMWGAALRKESDRVIIVPGQEKPLFMSSEMGKTIFQFKSFMFSATQRVLISNIQAQDKHYIQGMLGLVGIGMLSYAFKEWDANRELSDDPATWVMEGIDRSGALGMLMEVNNTLEKISGNHYGLRPLVGINAPASRYAARSALDSAIGPTFGLAGDVIKAASAVTGEREWTDADTRAFRRLLPGQNLSFLRQGLDRIEEELGQ